ncbi:hypothetical protein K491DRAFT_45240 [Lophiostoma macrostomum CBS 122681]|uniref:Uncharacterized protein n=1 Tax=Lophiostoma macrostomum CBS 122681 TaxID=1314788 RepID=A0A6A6SZQ6_9PLEO|nr:hypothetical protein K491DRAFT_45240 [Lophiostoma macrostomum CBS 122681]
MWQASFAKPTLCHPLYCQARHRGHLPFRSKVLLVAGCAIVCHGTYEWRSKLGLWQYQTSLQLGCRWQSAAICGRLFRRRSTPRPFRQVCVLHPCRLVCVASAAVERLSRCAGRCRGRLVGRRLAACFFALSSCAEDGFLCVSSRRWACRSRGGWGSVEARCVQLSTSASLPSQLVFKLPRQRQRRCAMLTLVFLMSNAACHAVAPAAAWLQPKGTLARLMTVSGGDAAKSAQVQASGRSSKEVSDAYLCIRRRAKRSLSFRRAAPRMRLAVQL